MLELETYEAIVATIDKLDSDMETWNREDHIREAEATEAEPAVAGRRLVCAPACGASEPRVVV